MRLAPSRTFSAVGRLPSNYGKSEVDGGNMPISIHKAKQLLWEQRIVDVYEAAVSVIREFQSKSGPVSIVDRQQSHNVCLRGMMG